MKSLLLLSIPLLALWPAPQVDSQTQSGSITGRIVFEGLRPATLPDLTFAPVNAECKSIKQAQELDAADRRLIFDAATGGVANVVLSVTGIDGKTSAGPTDVQLFMRAARFEPHVVIARPGDTLQFKNQDPCCHQLHTYSKKHKAINTSLCADDQISLELKQAELFTIKDDTHTWMQAHIFVTDAQAFCLSDSAGSFALEGLAPGSYAITWWHETLGRGKTQEIEVNAGQATSLDLLVSLKFELRANMAMPLTPDGAREAVPAIDPPQTPEPQPKAPAEQATRIPAPAEGTGQVSLSARWKGDLPETKWLPEINAAESVGCLHDTEDSLDRRDRTLLVDPNSRGIENVVFFLKNKDVAPLVPADPIRLDQSGCRFEPHVMVIPLGAQLAFANSDRTNHNIHTYARKNEQVNNNVAAGDTMLATLEQPETFEVKCDIHPWMKGYVVISDASRSGSSSSSGTLLLRDMPPGQYELSWWHESLGKGRLGSLEVVAGEVTTLSHEFDGKAKSGSRRRPRR